jgi:copper transport protein
MAASAHAVLVSSSPADGSRVASEPAAVRLRFDEAVTLIPSAAKVISSRGVRADTGHPRLVAGGTTIVLPLRPGLPAGTYSAVWRVVSADTHIVAGSVTFGLRVRPGAGVAAPVSRTGPLDVAAGVAQGLGYAGIVLLAGVAAAVRLIWPGVAGARRQKVLTRYGWVALAAGTAAEFLLQGPRADDAGWGAVVALRGAGLTASTLYGQELLARLGLLLLISPFVLRGTAGLPAPGPAGPGPRGWARDAALAAAGLAILASVAVTGHAAAGSGVALALLAALAHLAAMSLWLGGLTVLAVLVLPALRRDGGTDGPARLRRWSVTAYVCVVVLVITGEYQAYRQVSPVQALWSTRYGIILLVKVALVAAMLAAAAVAQRRVARWHAAPEPSAGPAAVRALTRSAGVELTAAVAVLGVTAGLVAQAPGRETYGPPVTLTAPLGADHLAVRVGPTRRGPEAFDIRVLDAAGHPVPAQTLTASVSSDSVAALAVTLQRVAGDGSHWVSSAAVVPLPGVWTLTLNVGLGPATAYATSVAYRVW